MDRAFRYRTERILPFGGGAHIDMLLVARSRKEENIIVWFPTFRDSESGKLYAEATIQNILSSPLLRTYLEKENLHLALIRHVNMKSSNSDLGYKHYISEHRPDELLGLLSKAVCLITDYSGVTFDWLCFNRPVIHFPFDKAEFLKSRTLLNTFDDIKYGQLVYSKEEFLGVLCSNMWRDMTLFSGNRERLMELVYPNLSYGYSERCYQVINKLLENFDERSRKLVVNR